MKYLTLNNAMVIPQLGFGTADIGDRLKTIEAINHALDTGFRRFDTASMYGNESFIAEAIGGRELNREEVILTTKLWDGGNYSFQNTKSEIERSMGMLQTDYIDIYLQHWPVPTRRHDAWRAMQEGLETGDLRAIGVSNFTVSHLEELISRHEIIPVINQVEFNPFLYQVELLEFCNSEGIILEAYSPFSKARRLENEIIVQIANDKGRTPAQIILRWCIQLGISVIPKASSEPHIQENFSIFDFELTTSEMDEISELDEGYRIEWDPTDVV